MTLKQDLRGLLALARSGSQVPQRRILPRGLIVEVTQLPNGNVQLSLERVGVEPSDQEWTTVLRHWPEAVPEHVAAVRRKEARHYFMVGRWPRPVEAAAPASLDPTRVDPG